MSIFFDLYYYIYSKINFSWIFHFIFLTLGRNTRVGRAATSHDAGTGVLLEELLLWSWSLELADFHLLNLPNSNTTVVAFSQDFCLETVKIIYGNSAIVNL